MVKILLIVLLILVTIFGIIISLIVNKELNRRNNIKENELKNNLYRIYTDLDLVQMDQYIDELLNRYISKWILVNITSKNGNYIKESEINQLIKDVTMEFIVNISPVQLFYAQCLSEITNDDSLTRFVREKVKFLVLDKVNDFNSES